MLKFFIVLTLIILLTDRSFAANFNISSAGNTYTSDTPGMVNDDTITFTSPTVGSFTFDNAADFTLSGISSNNPGIGTITSPTNSVFNINYGDVGSATNPINQIQSNSNQIYFRNSNIYTDSGIIIDDDPLLQARQLIFIPNDGNDMLIDSTIGDPTEYFTGIIIYPSIQGTDTAFFNDSIYTNQTQVHTRMEVMDGATNVNLGDIDMNSLGGGIITLNANANATTYNDTILGNADEFIDNVVDNQLTIASNKTLTISGTSANFTTTQINDTINLGIANNSPPSIDSSNDVTINNGATINLTYDENALFEYGDHIFLQVNDKSLTVDLDNVTLNHDLNSYILDSSIIRDDTSYAGKKTLVFRTSLKSEFPAILGEEGIDNIEIILNDELGDAIKAEIFKISDFDILTDSLDSLSIGQSNMVQTTSLNVVNKIDNVINYRTAALNFNDVGFSSGNTKKERGIIWGEFFGGYTKQDKKQNSDGYSSNISGIIFGADGIKRTQKANIITGIAMSYANSDINGDSLSNRSTNINSYQLTLYNNISANNGMGFFNENSITGGYNQYTSSRNIELGSIKETANSDYIGTSYGLKTGLGYNLKIANTLFLSPNIALKYSSLTLDDYVETGAGIYNLDVKNESFDTTAMDIGIRVMGEVDTGKSNYSIFPQLNLSWTRNLSTNGAESETSFVGSSTKNKVVGNDLANNIFNAGIRFDIENNDATSFVISYDLQSSSGYKSHLGSIRYRWKF